jgi:hypothetical protein
VGLINITASASHHKVTKTLKSHYDKVCAFCVDDDDDDDDDDDNDTAIDA